MSAARGFHFVAVEDYLAAEESAAWKHEYDAVIPLDAIDETLALADLYERVDFAVAAAEDADERLKFGFDD